jgi:transposase
MREYLARDLQVSTKRTGDNRICHLLRTRPSLGSWLVNDKSLFAIHAGQHAWTRLTYDQKEMRERGIYPLFWPPFSPDLNPVEIVWNGTKDWIAKYYTEMMSYDELRVVVGTFPANEIGALVRELAAKKCSGSWQFKTFLASGLKCGRHLHPHLTYLVRRLILHLNAWTCMSSSFSCLPNAD